VTGTCARRAAVSRRQALDEMMVPVTRAHGKRWLSLPRVFGQDIDFTSRSVQQKDQAI
jgi:hypothetical protein